MMEAFGLFLIICGVIILVTTWWGPMVRAIRWAKEREK